MTAATLMYALAAAVWSPLTAAASVLVQQHQHDLFDFDFSWVPRSPVANDTVRFLAYQPNYAELWLPDDRFRWYKLLPRTGFRLLQVGPRYEANAGSDYFQGLYRLRVLLSSSEASSSGNVTRRYVDIVKYVGVQSRVRALLLADGRSVRREGDIDNRQQSVANLTCRFWGLPRLERLKFSAPTAAGCDGPQFAEHRQDQPYLDLVTRCRWLAAGRYVCAGGNDLGDWQLHCQLPPAAGLGDRLCYQPGPWPRPGRRRMDAGGREDGRGGRANSATKTAVAASALTAVGILAALLN